MDKKERSVLLDMLYFYARRNGQTVQRERYNGHRVGFNLCSVAIYGSTTYIVDVCMHVVPSDFMSKESEVLFDFLRPVYQGTAAGLERVLFERFNVSDSGILPNYPDKLVRFKGSKDGRELTENDHSNFDWMLQYCLDSCKPK